jgi:acetyl-CoA carboxylase biotin carboxyl carrier protein
LATEVLAHITGTVWKIEAPAGTEVSEGDAVVVLESMKMELPVEAPCAGTVTDVRVREGQPVQEGAVVAVIEERA